MIGFACACGASAPKPATEAEGPPPVVPIHVEWKVEQSEGHTVAVSLVVEGTAVYIGVLDAGTEFEAGTPATCALRAANTLRTELMCGQLNSYAADLVGGELLVTYVAGPQRDEMKRLPVRGDALTVKPLALPYPSGR